MKALQSYRELIAWQKSMDVAVGCYKATKTFPREETFGLAFQIRKSSVSIASNIAEGFNRRSRSTYLNHLKIALGSEGELATQLEIAVRVGILGAAEGKRLLSDTAEVGRVVNGLLKSIRAGRKSSRKSDPATEPY